MHSGGARRIHTVTAGYLRRFGRRGLIRRYDIASGAESEKGPVAFGWQLDCWGPDRELADAVEQPLCHSEDAALRMLRKLDSRWPLTSGDRAELAQFVAIHIVRTGAFRSFLRRVIEEAIEDAREQQRLAPEAFAAAARMFRGDGMHADALLGQISRIAGLLCSMHWSLVRFDRDLLIVGDQPVVILPMEPIAITPASAMPRSGLAHTVEIRFPLDPQTLLLMSWADAADRAEPIRGTDAHACNANCSERLQALQEWFYRPGAPPTFLAPPLLRPTITPLSFELTPGYDMKSAIRSARRQAADALMAKIIESQEPRDRVRWVTHRSPRDASALRANSDETR